jgi:hypothetical protein
MHQIPQRLGCKLRLLSDPEGEDIQPPISPESTATTTAFHFGNGWRCAPNQPESESNTHRHCRFHGFHHSTFGSESIPGQTAQVQSMFSDILSGPIGIDLTPSS